MANYSFQSGVLADSSKSLGMLQLKYAENLGKNEPAIGDNSLATDIVR